MNTMRTACLRYLVFGTTSGGTGLIPSQDEDEDCGGNPSIPWLMLHPDLLSGKGRSTNIGLLAQHATTTLCKAPIWFSAAFQSDHSVKGQACSLLLMGACPAMSGAAVYDQVLPAVSRVSSTAQGLRSWCCCRRLVVSALAC